MFKDHKKEDKQKKKQNTKDLPEEFKSEKEKLVENKMEEIESSLKKLDNKSNIDMSSIPDDLSKIEEEIKRETERTGQKKQKKQHIKNSSTQVSAKFKPELKDILPVWVEKPFYYITPQEKFQDRRKMWQKEWADFLIRQK